MDFLPMLTEECTLCEHRLKEGLESSCVNNCLARSLELCKDATYLLKAFQSGKRCQEGWLLELDWSTSTTKDKPNIRLNDEL